jgi:hypothetical protein
LVLRGSQKGHNQELYTQGVGPHTRFLPTIE